MGDPVKLPIPHVKRCKSDVSRFMLGMATRPSTRQASDAAAILRMKPHASQET